MADEENKKTEESQSSKAVKTENVETEANNAENDANIDQNDENQNEENENENNQNNNNNDADNDNNNNNNAVNDNQNNQEENQNNDNEDDKWKDEGGIYQKKIANRVIVAKNHPLSFYVDRARRILRMEQELAVSGRGPTISMACTLVEVLKRQKIADIEKITTGMHTDTYFTFEGEVQWSLPISQITFNLKRGEFAEFVADYHQRKVIEIFESKDTEKTGYLSFDEIEKLDFKNAFHANEEQIKLAEKYLEEQNSKQLNLPDFIRYASILIHPLLKDKVFKDVLNKKFDIIPTDRQ